MNRSTETTAHDHTARIARLAWFCAFVLPLILVGLLLGAKSAQAASPTPVIVPFALEDDEEELGFEDEGEELEDEDEFAEAECEIAEEELEEGLLTETDVKELCTPLTTPNGAADASGACPLRSARARAVENHNRLKVTVGYTSSAPTRATIELRSGNKRLATVHRKLSRSGVLRIVKKLGRKQVRRIKIRIRVPSLTGGRRCGLVQVVANKVI